MSLQDKLNQERLNQSGMSSNEAQKSNEIEELNKKLDLLLKKRKEDDYEKDMQEKNMKELREQALKAVREIETTTSKWNNTLDFDALGKELQKQINAKFSYATGEILDTSNELSHFKEKMQQTNKFFYPTLYGAFVAIVGFICLFLMQGIVGNLFGDSYYPMIATKVEQSTGFNTFMWYLAYLTPYVLIAGLLYFLIRFFFKKRGRYY